MSGPGEASTGKIDVRYVAHLARMHLTDEEVTLFGGQLQQVLDYVEELKRLDVGEVSPTAHAGPVHNVFRSDDISPCMDHDAVIKNAPAIRNGLITVPRILE